MNDNNPKMQSQLQDSTIAVDFGEYVTDSVTGYGGTVTGICLYDTGNHRVVVEAVVDGELKTEYFDPSRLTNIIAEGA